MKISTQVGLDPRYIVLDGDQLPLPRRGTAPIFGLYFCGQMAAWIKMPLGMGAGLDRGDFV